KVRHFPRDLSRRLRASRKKRRHLASGMPVASRATGPMSGSTPQNEREDENAGEAKTPQAEMEAEATELVDKALDAMRIASSIVPEFWLGGSRAQKTRPRKSTLS